MSLTLLKLTVPDVEPICRDEIEFWLSSRTEQRSVTFLTLPENGDPAKRVYCRVASKAGPVEITASGHGSDRHVAFQVALERVLAAAAPGVVPVQR